MNFESGERMAAYLREHHDFEECTLEDVRWRHFGTVLELVFDYVWAEDGSLREDLDTPLLKILRFHSVQEFHLRNALSEHVALHPVEVGWGISEVAAVQLLDDPELLGRYKSFPLPVHHVACRWETGRRIDVLFSTLQVL